MDYRKFKADNIFTGYEMLNKDFVLITSEDGSFENILPASEAGENIEIFKGIISPGFINCHCHLELSHMKNIIPEKTGMIDFLLTVIKQRNFSPEIIQQEIINGEEQMLQNGIVAVGDICNTADTLAQKKQGNLYYHNFIEATGFVEASASARFESSVEVFKKFAQQYSLPIESNSIVPHAPYSVSKKLFELIINFPGNHLLTIHNQESEAENEFLQSATGDFLRLYQSLGIDISFFEPTKKRSLENYLPYFKKNQSLILVHNVFTNDEDFKSVDSWQLTIDRKKNTNTDSIITNHNSAVNSQLPTFNLHFCLCPNANEYITGKLPDVDLLIKNNCSIVMGTDSLASNHQLNIIEELKTLQKNFPHLLINDLLKWATINGAKALQLESLTGSFEKGKQPGIVLIENVEEKKFTTNSTSQRIL